MPKGGKRAGAGRKKGGKNKQPIPPKPVREEARQLFEERVQKDLQPLLDITAKLALGGDVRMIINIWDRLLGKAVERHELSGADGGPLFVLPSDRLPDFGNKPKE